MDLDLDSKSVVLQNMRDEIEAELLRLEERKIQERREERRMVGVGGMSSSEHNNAGTRSIRVAGSASYHHRNSSSPPSSSDLNHLSSHSLRDMNHHSSNHSLRSGYYDQQDYEHAALRPPRDYEHAALRPPRSFGSLGSLSAGSLHDSYNGSQERPPRSFGSLGSLSAGSLHDSYNGSQEHPILPRVMGQREQYSQQLHNSFGSLETLSSQGSLHHSHRDAYRYDSQQRNSTWETTKSPSRALNSNDNIFFLEYGNSPMTSETIPLSSLESSRRVLQGVPPGNVPLPLNGIDEEETMVSCGSFQSSHYRRTKSPRRGRRPNNTTLETMSCGSSHSRLVDQQAQNDNTLETMSHTSLPGKWRGSPHQYEVDGDAMSIPPSPRYFRQQQVVYHRHHGSSSQEDPNIIHSLPPQERSSMYYSSPSPGGIQSLGLHEGVEVVQSPDISIVDSHHIPGTIVLDMNNRNNQNSDLTTVANTTEQHRRRLQKLSDIRSSRQERKCNEADDELICKYAPPLPELKKGELQISSKIWTSLSFLCTFPISDKFVPKEGVEAKQAWR